MNKLLLVTALAACHDSKPASPAPAAPPPKEVAKGDCKAQVDDVIKFLRAMDHTGSVFILDDIHLAMRPELPYVMARQAPMVKLLPGKIEYQDKTVTAQELATELAVARKRIDEDMALGRFPKHDPPDPKLIDVLIDADATWGDVVKMTDVLARVGFPHASIAFGKPSPVSPPPRTWVDDKTDELRKSHDGNAATELANLIKQIIPGCPQMISVFGEVGSSEGGDKVTEIIDGAEKALVACNCNLDLPAFRSVMWAVAGNPHPSTVIAIDLSKSGKAITQPAATKWSDAGKQLEAGASVHLVARP